MVPGSVGESVSAVEDAVVALEQSLTVDSRGAFSEAHEA